MNIIADNILSSLPSDNACQEDFLTRPPVTDSLGRALKDLRISLTDRCNLRCTYCMPHHCGAKDITFMPRGALLQFEEIYRVAQIAVRLGVIKIRLTGGEPLLRADVPALVRKLKTLPELHDLALSTNGFLLSKYAEALKQAGLDRVSVSLDSLDNSVFGQMNGLGISNEEVLNGIKTASQAGLNPIKINVVVQRGVNESTLVSLAEYFRHTGCIVRFIEYMDVGTMNGWKGSDVVPAETILHRINDRYPIQLLPEQYPGEVARRYVYKDGGGEIGMIASVTNPFCGDCTRLRLSADGKLYTCLFGDEKLDVRHMLRSGMSDSEIAFEMQSCWEARAERYSEERAMKSATKPNTKMEMFRLGG